MTIKKFQTLNGRIYAEVTVNTEASLITDKWVGPFENFENFKKVLFYIAEQIQAYNLKFWLADLRDMEGSFSEISDWLGLDFMPMVINYGLTREAIIVPKDVYARLAAKDTVQKILSLEIRTFDNYKFAQDWLLINEV